MNARRLTIGGIATLLTLATALMFAAGQAAASLGEFSYLKSFGHFESAEGVASDEATGDVYVYDSSAGVISKYDAEGNPVDFSALGSSQISGVGFTGGGEAELAVDNSSGPAQGDIYLAGGEEVKIYGEDGKLLGALTQAAGRPWGEVACGVAVDGSGNVYVGLYPLGTAYINEYTPTANPVTNSDYTRSLSGVNEVCNVAADPEGDVYADTWSPSRNGPLVEYVAGGGSKEVLAQAGGALAVANSPSAELFVPRKDEIMQFDSSGNLLSSFGLSTVESDKEPLASFYRSLAIDASDGRLYVYNDTDRTMEIWQGVIIPNVKTGVASGLEPPGDSVLEGSVNPEGASLESCVFEYGLTEAYGSTEACAQALPLTGTSTLPVSASLAGLELNHTYHYRLTTEDTQGGFHGSDQTFAILVPPTVEDQQPEASSILRVSVKLTGTVDPEEAETSYHFEYGISESYGQSTLLDDAGSGRGDTTVSQQLSELLPETTYHYRLVAKNVGGTSYGVDHTFTTGAATPPLLATGAASNVAQNSATIAGTVNTNGLPTTYGFEIGTSTDYGPPTGLGAVGAGASEVPVSLDLTGLLPGTTYHYRITATNIDGTTYGADETFTTSVFPNTFATPPAPLPFVQVPAISFPGKAKGVVKKRTGKGKRRKARREKVGKRHKPKPKHKRYSG